MSKFRPVLTTPTPPKQAQTPHFFCQFFLLLLLLSFLLLRLQFLGFFRENMLAMLKRFPGRARQVRSPFSAGSRPFAVFAGRGRSAAQFLSSTPHPVSCFSPGPSFAPPSPLCPRVFRPQNVRARPVSGARWQRLT